MSAYNCVNYKSTVLCSHAIVVTKCIMNYIQLKCYGNIIIKTLYYNNKIYKFNEVK